MKPIVHYTLPILIAFLIGCQQVNAHEKVTIVGRFRIQNSSGKFYGKDKWIEFGYEYGHKKSKPIQRKDSGYFAMKLPPGISFLKEVHYNDGGGEYLKKLPEAYMEIEAREAERVYYVGDIILLWDIEVNDESALTKLGTHFPNNAIEALVGFYMVEAVDGRKKQSALPIKVTREPATIARFAQEYRLDSSAIAVSLLHPSK